jgi:hypothetical protein
MKEQRVRYKEKGEHEREEGTEKERERIAGESESRE